MSDPGRQLGSSPRTPAPIVPLDAARGAVRDGAAAIDNLHTLLGSRRVGPRWLSHAIPAVQAGCAPLIASIGDLDVAIAAHFGAEGDDATRDALHAMLEFSVGRVRDLEAALAAALHGTIDARGRLTVEGVVRGVSNDLTTMVRLTDLVGAVTEHRSTAIDLGELLSERRAAVKTALLSIAAAVVELRTLVLVAGDARVIVELLEFAVARVARAGVTAPKVVAESRPDGSLVITVSAARGPTPPAKLLRGIEVIVRPELPREADVLRAAAKRAGIELVIAPDGATVTMTLPALPSHAA